MYASLPFAEPTHWTKLQFRSDITVAAGVAEIGILAGSGNHLYLEINRSAVNEVRLYQVGGCPILAAVCTLGTANLSLPGAEHNYRVVVEKGAGPSTWTVSVFVDGTAVSGLQSIATGSIGSIEDVYFAGASGEDPYPPGRAKVDNFEAEYFCTDETLCT